MKYSLLLISVFSFAVISAQKIYPEKLAGKLEFEFADSWAGSKNKTELLVDTFQISSQVTLGEYKVFLAAMKKDSGEACYISNLPDSSIMNEKDYTDYVNTKKYDDYSAVGVSWANAMNYCKWKTIKENKDSIQFFYRVPVFPEWKLAYKNLSDSKKTDFKIELYSDMLMNSYDESSYSNLGKELYFLYYYLTEKEDSKVIKRKRVAGSNWFYKSENSYSHRSNYIYSDEGYKYVSFRIVKISLKKLPAGKTEAERKKNAIEMSWRNPGFGTWYFNDGGVLKWWGLSVKK
ncbi:MAG: SUMF1/EgtB/PvdO family nonheme iron enzyme [Bacteroidia bacterium]|nr:SUMF1/EgtB/PvdO family nonheme iron enzyme [Bacteroidia bacterium]